MKGIGIDIAAIGRFKKISKSDFQRWNKIFTRAEWQYAFLGKRSAERLAGIFAAKEAAIKASAGIKKSFFSDWEITHRASGEPKLAFRGRKKSFRIFLSISHDHDQAVAVVMIV